MLLRMYERFCEKKDYTYEVIEEQKGDEAGIKSAYWLKVFMLMGILKLKKVFIV